MLELFEENLPKFKRSDDECWPYNRSAEQADWYGRISCKVDGMFHQALAHRVAWTYFNGPLPDGKAVLHACDYKPCVNPAHLHLGTQGDNISEAFTRGRNGGATGRTWKWKTTENHWRNRAKTG